MKKNVMIYCRISRDDGCFQYEKIETQKEGLIKYCEKNCLGKICAVIMHDNISGTDFARIDYIKKIIRKKNIHVLLMKDLSRLGRNMVKTLMFLEYLKENKIETVFADEMKEEEFYPIISWFNEQRAKEDGEKIRKTLHYKMEKGEIVFNPPFGYSVDNGHIVVDQDASAVIQKIFDLYTKGESGEDICNYLNKNSFLPPSLHSSKSSFKAAKWNKEQVLKILTNDFYLGIGRFGVYSKDSRDKPYVFKNHHEAIISADQFELVQNIMHIKKKQKRNERAKGLFSGIIFCGKCGSKMYLRKKGSCLVYICNRYNQHGSVGCSSHQIGETDLLEASANYIKSILKEIAADAIYIQQHKETLICCEKELRNAADKMIVLQKDNETGLIDHNLFDLKDKEIKEKINKIDCMVKIYSDFGNIPYHLKLNRNFIALLFEKVIMFEAEDIASSTFSIPLTNEELNQINLEGGIVFIKNKWLQ